MSVIRQVMFYKYFTIACMGSGIEAGYILNSNQYSFEYNGKQTTIGYMGGEELEALEKREKEVQTRMEMIPKIELPDFTQLPLKSSYARNSYGLIHNSDGGVQEKRPLVEVPIHCLPSNQSEKPLAPVTRIAPYLERLERRKAA